MVVIKKFENTIPIDFGEFELRFVASDENLQNLVKLSEKADKAEETFKNLKGTIDDLKSILEFTKELWIELFDEETFIKIYEYCNKSTIPTFIACIQAIRGLADEIPNLVNENTLTKYLSN